MKRILALAAAALLCIGAQAATGHHGAHAGAPSAKAAQAHKATQAHTKAAQAHKAGRKGGKQAVAHKRGAPRHAAKAQRKSGHKHA